MEQPMRCNNIKCRAELHHQAVVTTCSHIFCLDCAHQARLTDAGHAINRSCPACRSPLANAEEVVLNNLHPSEECKSTILSGLGPSVVMECAGRALSFWAYQMTQELVYQEHVSKNLTNKFSNLSMQLDKVINDAESQIGGYQSKVTGMALDHESLQRKNDELVQALKEKTKKLLRTQELYDKLKRKAMLGQIQEAASDMVTSNIEAAQAAGTTLAEHISQPGLYERQEHPGTPRHEAGIGDRYGMPFSKPGMTPGHYNVHGDGMRHQPMGPPAIPMTPTSHRQDGGQATNIGLTSIPGAVGGTPLRAPGSARMRQPFPGVQGRPPNAHNFPGVGISSGVKTGLVGSTYNFAGARPPVLQRPTPLNQPHQFYEGGNNHSSGFRR